MVMGLGAKDVAYWREPEARRSGEGQADNPNFALKDLSEALEWQKFKAIGNVMRHYYEKIRVDVPWKTINVAFSALQQETDQALEPRITLYQQQRKEPEQEL